MLIIFIHISLSLSLSLSIEYIVLSTVELQIVQIDHVCSFFPDDTQRKLNLRNWFYFIYKKIIKSSAYASKVKGFHTRIYNAHNSYSSSQPHYATQFMVNMFANSHLRSKTFCLRKQINMIASGFTESFSHKQRNNRANQHICSENLPNEIV